MDSAVLNIDNFIYGRMCRNQGVMRGNNDCFAGRFEISHYAHEFHAEAAVKMRGWFICEDYGLVVDQGPGYCYALHFSTGYLAGREIFPVADG